jgi:hypothetical protein
MQKPSMLLTAPVRNFFNARFEAVTLRLDQLEQSNARIERAVEELQVLARVESDNDEWQQAMLDSLAFLGKAIADRQADLSSHDPS